MKSFAAFLALSITAGFAAAAEPADPDIALEPAHIIVNPWRFHIPSTKRQGVPGIERTEEGVILDPRKRIDAACGFG